MPKKRRPKCQTARKCHPSALAEAGQLGRRAVLAGKLRTFREWCGLTQAELSSAVGVSRGTLTRWELGNRDTPAWVKACLLSRPANTMENDGGIPSEHSQSVRTALLTERQPGDGMILAIIAMRCVSLDRFIGTRQALGI